MLTSKRQFLLVACILIVALSGGLATAFSVQFSSELENQFNARAEIYARTFSDQVQFRLTQVSETDESIRRGVVGDLLRDRIRGDVIYAQVVTNGDVLAEERTYVVPPSQFEISDDDRPLVFNKHAMISGEKYLDVRRALVASPDPIDPSSYVRLGFSLKNFQHEVLNLILQSASWGLGGALGGIVLLLLVSRQFQLGAQGARNATTVITAPPLEPVAAADMLPPASAVAEASAATSQPLIACGEILIDDNAKLVRLNDNEIPMSPREYELLKLLCSFPGKIFSNDDIVKQVWQDDQFALPQDVKKYVYLLRKKIEDDPSNPKRLLTVRGFGYKMVDSTAG